MFGTYISLVWTKNDGGTLTKIYKMKQTIEKVKTDWLISLFPPSDRATRHQIQQMSCLIPFCLTYSIHRAPWHRLMQMFMWLQEQTAWDYRVEINWELLNAENHSCSGIPWAANDWRQEKYSWEEQYICTTFPGGLIFGYCQGKDEMAT